MENEFLKDWLNILRNCNYDNTYKMAWAKAITEIVMEIDFRSQRHRDITITLEQIAHRVIKYYWNQTIYFDLVQGSNPLRPPKILSLTKELIECYFEIYKTKQPIRFEKLDIEGKLSPLYKSIIKKIITVLKQDVSYRFVNLQSVEPSSIYIYIKGEDELTIKPENAKMLKDNCIEIFETINYRWAIILETFNSTPRICKKVKIIDEKEIKRNSLNKFIRYLDYENPNHICFICGEKIEDDLSIDHVIPWSYLYSDDIWNLVYVHQSCNSSKSNVIPNEVMIRKLKVRNADLYKAISDEIMNKVVEELKLAIDRNYVDKFWIACQG